MCASACSFKTKRGASWSFKSKILRFIMYGGKVHGVDGEEGGVEWNDTEFWFYLWLMWSGDFKFWFLGG
jgi:hypothetical protein